jgi:hypothetical protein
LSTNFYGLRLIMICPSCFKPSSFLSYNIFKALANRFHIHLYISTSIHTYIHNTLAIYRHNKTPANCQCFPPTHPPTHAPPPPPPRPGCGLMPALRSSSSFFFRKASCALAYCAELKGAVLGGGGGGCGDRCALWGDYDVEEESRGGNRTRASARTYTYTYH